MRFRVQHVQQVREIHRTALTARQASLPEMQDRRAQGRGGLPCLQKSFALTFQEKTKNGFGAFSQKFHSQFVKIDARLKWSIG